MLLEKSSCESEKALTSNLAGRGGHVSLVTKIHVLSSKLRVDWGNARPKNAWVYSAWLVIYRISTWLA